VTFKALTEAEIKNYWQTGEPADKAGAYGIQGLGAIFVKEIKGSYSGIMGLPVFETISLLAKIDITAEKILEQYT
jgi:septum formation protein